MTFVTNNNNSDICDIIDDITITVCDRNYVCVFYFVLGVVGNGYRSMLRVLQVGLRKVTRELVRICVHMRVCVFECGIRILFSYRKFLFTHFFFFSFDSPKNTKSTTERCI